MLCAAAEELAELGQNSPTSLGRRHAAKSHGRHYMYGVARRARIVNPISERHYIVVLDVPFIATTQHDARVAVGPLMYSSMEISFKPFFRSLESAPLTYLLELEDHSMKVAPLSSPLNSYLILIRDKGCP